jgi:hypothetical protein
MEEYINNILRSVCVMAEELNSYDDMALPALCMLIEKMARKNNMHLMDFYHFLEKNAAEVIEEHGDVI